MLLVKCLTWCGCNTVGGWCDVAVDEDEDVEDEEDGACFWWRERLWRQQQRRATAARTDTTTPETRAMTMICAAFQQSRCDSSSWKKWRPTRDSGP